jgi:hypothetical protein
MFSFDRGITCSLNLHSCDEVCDDPLGRDGVLLLLLSNLGMDTLGWLKTWVMLVELVTGWLNGARVPVGAIQQWRRPPARATDSVALLEGAWRAPKRPRRAEVRHIGR